MLAKINMYIHPISRSKSNEYISSWEEATRCKIYMKIGDACATVGDSRDGKLDVVEVSSIELAEWALENYKSIINCESKSHKCNWIFYPVSGLRDVRVCPNFTGKGKVAWAVAGLKMETVSTLDTLEALWSIVDYTLNALKDEKVSTRLKKFRESADRMYAEVRIRRKEVRWPIRQKRKQKAKDKINGTKCEHDNDSEFTDYGWWIDR